MIAKDLISYHIPSASSSATGDDILSIMDEHRISHIPIVDKENYHGIISEDEILDLEDPSKAIKNIKSNLNRPFVSVYSHIYDAIKVLTDYKITTIPVLGEQQEYLGLIAIQDLAFNFAQLTNAHEPGGILVLGINIRDYSLAQAAQIVESDNAKILSSYISSIPNSLQVDLILKINKKDLTTIVSAFGRYNYEIKATFHESIFDDDLQRRYEQFMNYLNM